MCTSAKRFVWWHHLARVIYFLPIIIHTIQHNMLFEGSVFPIIFQKVFFQTFCNPLFANIFQWEWIAKKFLQVFKDKKYLLSLKNLRMWTCWQCSRVTKFNIKMWHSTRHSFRTKYRKMGCDYISWLFEQNLVLGSPLMCPIWYNF